MPALKLRRRKAASQGFITSCIPEAPFAHLAVNEDTMQEFLKVRGGFSDLVVPYNIWNTFQKDGGTAGQMRLLSYEVDPKWLDFAELQRNNIRQREDRDARQQQYAALRRRRRMRVADTTPPPMPDPTTPSKEEFAKGITIAVTFSMSSFKNTAHQMADTVYKFLGITNYNDSVWERLEIEGVLWVPETYPDSRYQPRFFPVRGVVQAYMGLRVSRDWLTGRLEISEDSPRKKAEWWENRQASRGWKPLEFGIGRLVQNMGGWMPCCERYFKVAVGGSFRDAFLEVFTRNLMLGLFTTRTPALLPFDGFESNLPAGCFVGKHVRTEAYTLPSGESTTLYYAELNQTPAEAHKHLREQNRFSSTLAMKGAVRVHPKDRKDESQRVLLELLGKRRKRMRNRVELKVDDLKEVEDVSSFKHDDYPAYVAAAKILEQFSAYYEHERRVWRANGGGKFSEMPPLFPKDVPLTIEIG